MKKETLQELCSTDFTKFGQSKRQVDKALRFIHTLLFEGVKIDQINVTDWKEAPVAVHVGDKQVYRRFSGHDLQQALRAHKETTQRLSTSLRRMGYSERTVSKIISVIS